MRLDRILAIALVVLAASARAEAPICLDEAEVCLETVLRGRSVDFVVTNRTVAPYSVRILPSALEHLKPQVAPPFRGVVPPGERRTIGTLVPTDPHAAGRYRYRWGAALGSLLARHDAGWRYRMPFGGDAARRLLLGVGAVGGDVEAGNRVPDVPRFSSSLSLAYAWQLPAFLGLAAPVLDLRLDYRYVGKRPADPQNSFDLDAYNKVDLRIGLTSGAAEIYLWGDNLLDEQYDLYGFNEAFTLTGVPVQYGAPARGRTIGLGVSYHF